MLTVKTIIDGVTSISSAVSPKVITRGDNTNWQGFVNTVERFGLALEDCQSVLIDMVENKVVAHNPYTGNKTEEIIGCIALMIDTEDKKGLYYDYVILRENDEFYIMNDKGASLHSHHNLKKRDKREFRG